jgi:hypothetical protein
MESGYKQWITNCEADVAFEYLVKCCSKNPSKQFTIGPPQATRSTVGYMPCGEQMVLASTPGCTVEMLERWNFRGIYEC